MGKPARDLACLALGLLLFERIDQFDRREEAHSLAVVLDGLDAEGRGDVRLASPAGPASLKRNTQSHTICRVTPATLAASLLLPQSRITAKAINRRT